jgi:hypothetical protein
MVAGQQCIAARLVQISRLGLILLGLRVLSKLSAMSGTLRRGAHPCQRRGTRG